MTASSGGRVPASAHGGESGFSPEMRALMLLARPELDSGVEARVRDLVTDGLDWGRLLALARRHRLTPLLATHLRRFPGLVPNEVERALAEARLRNAARVLERTAQLFELLSALEERGIVAVPYKGPALAAQLYGFAASRAAGDLDVLVRPRDAPAARRVLASLDYRPRVPLDADGVRFMLRHRYDEEFVREDGSHVELHWAFTNRGFRFPLDLDGVFSRLGAVPLTGHRVPAFHPQDLLLILSVHGAKHRWDRLEWVAGVAQLLRGPHPFDWEVVAARADTLGIRRTLHLGLLLAADLLEAPLPPAVLEEARADRTTGPLMGEVVHLLHRAPAGWDVPDRLERDRFRIRLQERWRDRLRFVWHRAITPSDPAQWEVARLGRCHVPLHAFRRPFRVTGELLFSARALVPWSA